VHKTEHISTVFLCELCVIISVNSLVSSFIYDPSYNNAEQLPHVLIPDKFFGFLIFAFYLCPVNYKKETMKKLFIAAGTLVLTAIIAILFVNANPSGTREAKNSSCINKEIKCPDSTKCMHADKGNKACCDKKQTQTMKCDPKACDPKTCDTTKCKPSTCTHHEMKAVKEEKKCSPTCTGKCPSKAGEKK
jgi:hypothetical protein